MKNIIHYIFLLAIILLVSCESEKWEVDVPAKESIYELTNIKSGNISIDKMEVYRNKPLMIQFKGNLASSFKTTDFIDNSTNTTYDFSFKIVSQVDAADSEGGKVERIDEYVCHGDKETGNSTMEVTTTIGSSVTKTTYTLNISEVDKYVPTSEQCHYKADWDTLKVKAVMVDSFLTFVDKSVGCKYHEWTIEEGNALLKNGFNVDDDLRKQVVQGLTSNDDAVSVLFGKVGLTTVTLRNHYDKPVAVEDGSLRAILDENSGDWVITKKFEVDVYGGLEPKFRITNLATGETIDENSDYTTWTLEIGQKIKVEDLTEFDSPNARSWNMEGSVETTSTQKEAEFTFASIGEYSEFSFVSKRTEPASVALEVTHNIPLKVIVKKTEKPFTMQSISISSEANNNIVLIADGIFKNENLDQALKNFTLKVVGVDGNLVENVSVTGVKVSEDGNLILVLSDRIYEGETVKLAYNGDNLTSADGRVLSGFDANVVNNIKDTSVLPSNGGRNVNSFEGSSGYWLTNEWWAASTLYGKEGAPIQGSSEQACDGSRSLKISYTESTTIAEANLNALIRLMYRNGTYNPSVKAGNYKFSYNIYVGSESNENIKSKTIEFEYGENAANYKKLVECSLDQSRGKWVKLSEKVSLDSDVAKFILRITVPSCESLQLGAVFYIDDIQLIPVR